MEKVFGITYTKPEVTLLQETGIGVAEIAARTCYDSFESSENEVVADVKDGSPTLLQCEEINSIQSSSLLHKLAWTHFHHSILEHANLSYLIRGTSRAVLQEHARHRIQSISVRSTRYTMSSIINAFVASREADREFFIDKVHSFNMFVTSDENYNKIEISSMYDKLNYQLSNIDDFDQIAVAKSSLPLLESSDLDADALFEALERGKKKRNVGDAFKHIIGDNVKVDMVVTFNIRSLKNYLSLRDSGSAYFQIRWLAQEMMRVTPKKYLDLIIKSSES